MMSLDSYISATDKNYVQALIQVPATEPPNKRPCLSFNNLGYTTVCPCYNETRYSENLAIPKIERSHYSVRTQTAPAITKIHQITKRKL
ncbi:hypothetical protein BDZ91DRAFT_723679, partial [Kalaharituber pfeilii]